MRKEAVVIVPCNHGMAVDMRLAVVYGSSFLVNLILAIVAPFYPIEAERKGAPVWVTGLIFSAMPLATFVCSPLVGTYLQYLGRRRAFCTGTICEVTPT